MAGAQASPSASTSAFPDNRGFIYGTATLRSGESHSGFLRWRDEEAFWDDLFHSRQDTLPWFGHVDLEELKKERRRRYFETHGLLDRVMYSLHSEGRDLDPRRLFICRFGDIASIEIDDDENVTVVTADGYRQPVRGYSNDVSSDVLVYADADEPVEIEWDDLALITFAAAPPVARPYAERLYGRVTSTRGDFAGYIQWDQSECTTIDVLDGDGRDVILADVRSITRNRRNEADIELKDGEAFSLGGSNDVDGGNRGIVVETRDFGRINIPWNRFESVTFEEGRGSGTGRADFAPIEPLRGVVTDQDGQNRTGRIAWDLDEAWTRDIFNGVLKDIDYNIPFGLIRRIENAGDETCRVTLADGRVLELTGNQDTGEDHGGVLVLEDGVAEPVYLPWSRFQSLEFLP